MIPTPDSVARQRLLVDCDSASDAAGLRTRLADLNRSRLLPVIERVLAEASRVDRRIHIERLEVDLGTFRPEDVEALAPERLSAALSAALREALDALPAQQSQPQEDAWLSVFEGYLLTGTLPFWVGNQEPVSLGGLMMELAERQPSELVAVIRGAGRQDDVLRRVVLQYLPEELRALVDLLDPAHAGLILAYVEDIGATNRMERLTRLADPEFERLLWLLVLRFLVRDPGSQFNRRFFVRSLLEGIADRAGITYIALLHIFSEALARLASRLNPRFSLPAVIAELVEEADPIGIEPRFAEVDGKADSGDTLPTESAARRVLARWFPPSSDRIGHNAEEDLAEQMRRLIRDRQALRRFASELLPAEFEAAVRLLQPEHATVVIAYTLDVVAIAPLEVLTPARESDFEVLLRVLVLSYLAREPGSQFNRRAFVRSLIEGLAQESRSSYEIILDLLNRTSDHSLLRSSLPGVLRELFHESKTAQRAVLLDAISTSGSASEPGSWNQPHTVDDLRSRLAQLLPALAAQDSPLAVSLEAALSQVSDPRGLFERLLTAVQQGRLLDMEHLVRETNAAHAHPETESIGGLQRAIDKEISSPQPDRIVFHRLLDDLLERDLRAGRLFLRSRLDRSPERESILERLAPERMPYLLDVLPSRQLPWLPALLDACLQLPLLDRPTWRQMHHGLLTELLRHDPGDTSDPALIAGILSAIFPSPLPERVRAALVERIPADHAGLVVLLSSGTAQRPGLAPQAGDPVETARLLEAIFDTSSGANTRQQVLSSFEDLLRLVESPSNARATELRRALRLHLANPSQRERLVRLLPEATLVRLIEALEAGRAHALLSGARLIARAMARSSQSGSGEDRLTPWEFVLEAMADPAAQPLDAILDRSLASVTAQGASTGTVAESRRIQPLLLEAERLAREAGHVGLRAALERRRDASRRSGPPDAPAGKRTPSHSSRRKESASMEKEPFYVSNAGLVLVSPFLPHLFLQLDLLEPAGPGRSRWRNPDAASRAVHLTQYLVDGRSSTPEPRLVFNKVLCGLAPATPVARSIDLTPLESETCDALLRAVLANWTTISSSSVEALRETFLQRQGRLELVPGHNTLQVERKTLDVLVDRIPWSFRLTFNPWMPEPLHVVW